MSNYKCEKCGQTSLTQEQEAQLIEECKECLPDAYKNKTSEKEFERLKTFYGISKNTIRYTILPKHGITFDKPTKPKKVIKKSRYTDEEYQKIISAYEVDKRNPRQIFDSRLLGDRTPPVITIQDILSRKSSIYRDTNANKRKKADLDPQIIQLWDVGTNIDEIASQLKTSRKTVEKILFAAGNDLSPGKTYEEKLAIYHHYMNFTDKDATEETAKAKNTSPTTVRRIVKELVDKGFAKKDNSPSYRKYVYNQDFFEVIDSEEKLYILGLIATDGNVYENRISIELNRKDIEILQQISFILKSNKPVELTTHISKCTGLITEGARISFTSDKMVKDLAKFGIYPNKSLTLKLDLSSIPFDQQTPFWRGCIDGDGAIFNRDLKSEHPLPTLDFYGTLDMCNMFKDFVEKKWGIKIGGPWKHYSVWRVACQTKVITPKLAKNLYQEAKIYLKRKKDIVDTW